MAELARWLGEGLALVADAFDPELVVIGGGVSVSAPLFLDEAREHYAARLTGAGRRPLARSAPRSSARRPRWWARSAGPRADPPLTDGVRHGAVVALRVAAVGVRVVGPEPQHQPARPAAMVTRPSGGRSVGHSEHRGRPGVAARREQRSRPAPAARCAAAGEARAGRSAPPPEARSAGGSARSNSPVRRARPSAFVRPPGTRPPGAAGHDRLELVVGGRAAVRALVGIPVHAASSPASTVKAGCPRWRGPSSHAGAATGPPIRWPIGVQADDSRGTRPLSRRPARP